MWMIIFLLFVNILGYKVANIVKSENKKMKPQNTKPEIWRQKVVTTKCITKKFGKRNQFSPLSAQFLHS